ncbi:hypothetical protein ACFJIW_05885 [Tahibacter sp. UC22_41]|uniref:hypothetical protein n=1 Tax=Tahibacter sp. UC22_41 TaxID=3350178 RepID=UPI0036DD9856
MPDNAISVVSINPHPIRLLLICVSRPDRCVMVWLSRTRAPPEKTECSEKVESTPRKARRPALSHWPVSVRAVSSTACDEGRHGHCVVELRIRRERKKQDQRFATGRSRRRVCVTEPRHRDAVRRDGVGLPAA